MLLLFAIPYFVLLIVIEVICDRIYRLNNYEWRDSVSSVFMGFASLFINAIPHTITYPLFQYLTRYRVFDVQPTILSYLVLLLLYDFSFYWSHRVSHRCRLLWASHVVHHSSEKFVLTTALRQSWTDAIFNTMFYLYLPIIGYPLSMIVVVRAINLVYQFWIHTEFKISLGFLDYVFNVPEYHSIHHSSNQEYLGKKLTFIKSKSNCVDKSDCNYGGMFVLFDRIFGTFTENKSIRIVYGITTPIDTYNPLKIAFHEWIDMIKDCYDALSKREWRNAFLYVFAPPGWKPT